MAFQFYEAIATPGAVAPEMPEFLYNEEVELDLDELIETEDEEFEELDELSPEEVLDELADEASSEKREQLVEDIESGNIAAGHGGDGDYAISKNIGSEEDEDSSSEVEVVDDFGSDIEVVDDFSSDVEEVEEFSQATDSIPEKKISVSIEQLRKKMGDDKEN